MLELVRLLFHLLSIKIIIYFFFIFILAPRSGLALKNGIDVGAGVIDYDYRGNVGVILFNHNDSEFVVKEGDRIAQLILEKIVMADPVEVAADEDLPSTERGSGGFGSTGVNGEEVKKPRI